MKKPTMRGLQLQNARLAKEMTALKNHAELQDYQVRNSLSSLVSSAQAQSNITSFNPLFSNTIFTPLTLNYSLLTFMYKTHGILQAAIDMPVQDGLRGGVQTTCPELDADDLQKLDKVLERKGVWRRLAEATNWKRLYGGAALILNDGSDPSKPLDYKKIGDLKFYAANRWEFQYPGVNPKAQWELMGFGVPTNLEHYLFYGQLIHRSRVLILVGKPAPYMLQWQLQGWGMSEMERMVEDFNLFLRNRNVLYELLDDAKTDAYKIKGLNAALLSAVGTAKIQQRIEFTNKLKNFHKALVMDFEDDYVQKQVTFSGIAEIMKEIRVGVASSVRIPMTKLYGQSATGFSSGEDDIENYNGMVESDVREELRAPVHELLKIGSAYVFGEPFDIDFTFKPLRVLGAVEEENVKTSKQARYTALWDRGVMTTKELGETLVKEGLVTIDLGAATGLMDDLQPPAMAQLELEKQQMEAGKKPEKEKEKGGSKNE